MYFSNFCSICSDSNQANQVKKLFAISKQYFFSDKTLKNVKKQQIFEVEKNLGNQPRRSKSQKQHFFKHLWNMSERLELHPTTLCPKLPVAVDVDVSFFDVEQMVVDRIERVRSIAILQFRTIVWMQ